MSSWLTSSFLQDAVKLAPGRTFKNCSMGSRGRRKGEVAQTMYTHESKCKNNKRKY
jgi:hypothetical protein